MELIKAATILYEAISEQKPKTDTMYLEFQQFMVTHFNHAGTLAMREVDEKTAPAYVAQPTGIRMQAFKHPLNQAKPVQAAATEGAKGNNKVSQNDELTKKKNRDVEQPEDELGNEAGHHEGSQHQNEGVAAGDVASDTEQPDTVTNEGQADNHTQDAVTYTTIETEQPNTVTSEPDPEYAKETQQIDVEFVKATRAKAIGQTYKREALIDFITLKGVALNGNESNTQLGGIVKNLVNA